MPDTDRPSWLAVHAYAHSDLDVHLPTLVSPLPVVRAELSLPAWFYLRYWDGGPHVRLRLLCTGREQRDDAAVRITEVVARWAAAHPDPTPLTAEQYERQTRWILDRERVASGPLPLRRSRSWSVEPFDGEWMPGAPPCTDQPDTLRFLTASSVLALRSLRAGTWSGRLLQAINLYRRLLRSGDGIPDLPGLLDDWWRRLAGDRRDDVDRRCLAQAPVLPPVPAGPATAEALLAAAVLRVGDGPPQPAAVRQALHTHCNRLGLQLLDEAVAVRLALLTERERVR